MAGGLVNAGICSRWIRQTGRRPLKWVGVVVVLLSLTTVGAVQVPLAQAAPQQQTYRFSLDVASPRNTLCLGETVQYTATVLATPLPGTPLFIDVPGVTVEAAPNDPSVGHFLHANKAGFVHTKTGSLGVEPSSADFTFVAGTKPGKTTLVFQGLVKGFDAATGYVSFQVGIRVIPCKFKVRTTSRFQGDSINNPDIPYPPILSRMKTTEITGDATGHFTGESDVTVIGSTKAVQCSVSERFTGASHVDISGDLFEDGSLVLNFTYTPVTSSATERCGPAAQSGAHTYTFDALKVSVRPTGGTIRSPHTYNGGQFKGTTTVVVTAEKP